MFSPDDFKNADTVQMLNVIIMAKLQKPPLTNFHKMKTKEKTQFNKYLNDYIFDLPKQDWKEHMTAEYNTICNEEIFNESFDTKNYEPLEINTEIEHLE